MNFLNKKNYIILFFFTILLLNSNVFAKNNEIQYTRENISNYFSGIISSNQDYSGKALKHFKKVKSLKHIHSKFNIEYIRTLVLVEKFDEALSFGKSVWDEEELFFEADLLLGLDHLIKKDYINSEKYFERLNEVSGYNLFFKDFIGNILIAWSKAFGGNKEESLEFFQKIPKPYQNIVKTQLAFFNCYYDHNDTQETFHKLVEDENYNFARYNFFLANYLLHQNQNTEAKKVIKNSRKKYFSNLLINQSENFLLSNESNKIKNMFSCHNPKDLIAEFFYIMANFYASENNFKLSNFYLKISLHLNRKFLPNKALLAENFYYQNQFQLSQNIHESIKSIGPIYSWYASKNIASILSIQKGDEYSIKNLEADFNLISNPNFEHYYDLANFYKNNEYYEKSIKYYSLALAEIEKNHFLLPKILDRRGTSFERIGDWENAEKDLTESLKILPDQPHVLNYLAYSWVDKKKNLDEALEMLKKATALREDDGYIIDSLGWAYYMKKNYIEAEFFLQKAVELLPSDPIINDHYADTLWMLNKNIQARYVWNNVLKLSDAEQELKDNINKKLIFGVKKKM